MIVQPTTWHQCQHLRCWVLLLSGCLFIQPPVFAAPAQDEDRPVEERADTNLRARLTERENENRVEKPWTTQFFGHPLSATLQYELAFDWTRPIKRNNAAYSETRVVREQYIEPELFYTLGPQLSFFAQARAGMENATRAASQSFVERGEVWLHAQPSLSLPVTFEIGRLDFEDDRRWWWDGDLDALRVTLTTPSFELAVALAREVSPTRSDRDFIEPENEALRRWFVEASWDWRVDQSIQFFALFHDDRSPTSAAGEVVAQGREDTSDATLTWLGARAAGARAWPSAGSLGYWLDAAWVSGSERALDFMPVPGTRSVVNGQVQRDVRGWAFDVGTTWIAPFAHEPRFTLGYARGSGDPNPSDGSDRAFRQTGLQSNTPGFGGVQNFRGYGLLLDPELSNLAIVTAGAGISLFETSSLDFVYHYYRQVQPADTLRADRLNSALNGVDRDLGHGLDLVLAVEEWGRLHFEISVSALRAGAAFGTQRGQWAFGAFAELRFAF